jgi:hypothetical protein
MATLWVLGIELDAPIHLESGVIIQPIENMPDSNEKEIFSAAHFRPFTFFGSNALPRVAITTTYLENKKGSPDVTNTKRITVERACFNDLHPILNDIALLLNALPNVVCVPHVSTAYVQQTIPNGIFSNPGYGSQLVDVATFNSRKIDSAIGPEIDLLLSSFNSLPIKERSRLRLILRRLSQAKRRTQLEDKMLDIGLALEMLLIDDSKTDTQLSLTFRIRGSWLTGKSGTERLENWELLKQIYNARSDVAHTGELSGGKAAAIQKIQDNVPKYVQLAENILRKIIIDGRPDWTSLILDSALHATEES